MKAFSEADLVDYLSGEMPREERLQLERTLEVDPDLAVVLTELAAMQTWMVKQEEPKPWTTESTILALTNAAQKSKRISGWRTDWRYWSSAAAALLLFAAGWAIGQHRNSDLENELADIRLQVETLMQDQRTSSRMRAVTLTHQLPSVDQGLVFQLGRLLREDDSPNVQLAALEALSAYPNDLNTRHELINALATDLPAVVQIQLIETLVKMKEVRILPQLESWSEDASTPTHLRDAAQLGRLKLNRI
ncbi:MAG: hypothetical protein AAF433_07515 [Bacteroidota bacterium]